MHLFGSLGARWGGIRALLTHEAEWTEPMRAEIDGATSKTARLALLRRYGWGVPSEEAVLTSAQNAVTMLTQDEFVPFDEEHKARNLRLHSLPWPVEELRELGAATVTLRVTLSYFIEPPPRAAAGAAATPTPPMASASS